jgi:hypothetical protein
MSAIQVKCFPTQVKWPFQKVKCKSPSSVICLLTKFKCPPPFSHKSSACLTLHVSSVQASALSKSICPSYKSSALVSQVLCNVHTFKSSSYLHRSSACPPIHVKCLPTEVMWMPPCPPPPYSCQVPLYYKVLCNVHVSHSGQVLTYTGQVHVPLFRSNVFPQRSSECPLPSLIMSSALLMQSTIQYVPFSHKSRSSLKLGSSGLPHRPSAMDLVGQICTVLWWFWLKRNWSLTVDMWAKYGVRSTI